MSNKKPTTKCSISNACLGTETAHTAGIWHPALFELLVATCRKTLAKDVNLNLPCSSKRYQHMLHDS